MLLRRRRLFSGCALSLLVLACAALASGTSSPPPGARAAVAAEDPRAAEIGAAVFAAGGGVVDAAVATAFAVCVLNLSSCGLGGGGFLLAYDASQGEGYALDFREVAPSALQERLLLRAGEPDPTKLRRGGLAVGVPGFVAGLVAAHARFGKLSLSRLLAPSIELAEKGFPIGEHLAAQISREREGLAASPELGALFFDEGGEPKGVGATLAWPALAETLRAVASAGEGAFYRGRSASSIVSTVQAAGGVMTTRDLESYRPLWRRPLTGRYRGLTLLTMPPPGSGGVVIEILNVLGAYELASLGSDSPTYLHLLAEAMRVGFSDRALWYGDPAYTEVPLERLLSASHAAKLRSSISHLRAGAERETEQPADSGTSHLSVMDERGNAAAVTVTINTAFGSLLAVPETGIILNNEMDDFSLPERTPNFYGLVGAEPNRIAPGKRPLSSMSPTIGVAEGKAVLAIGASGGPRIISSIVQVLIELVDFGRSSEQAVASSRIHHQAVPPKLFFEPGLPPLSRLALHRMGHELALEPELGAVQVAHRFSAGLAAAADPRKQGGVAYWAQSTAPATR